MKVDLSYQDRADLRECALHAANDTLVPQEDRDRFRALFYKLLDPDDLRAQAIQNHTEITIDTSKLDF